MNFLTFLKSYLCHSQHPDLAKEFLSQWYLGYWAACAKIQGHLWLVKSGLVETPTPGHLWCFFDGSFYPELQHLAPLDPHPNLEKHSEMEQGWESGCSDSTKFWGALPGLDRESDDAHFLWRWEYSHWEGIYPDWPRPQCRHWHRRRSPFSPYQSVHDLENNTSFINFQIK